MSNRKKDSEILAEINRYLNNKMSNKERYEFERLLERDPFLADALDGISNFRVSDVEKDLNAIDILSGKKRKKINPVVYLFVAAGFLLIIVSVFLFQNKDKKQVISSENIEQQNRVAKRDTLLFAEQVDTSKVDSSGILIAEVKSSDVEEAQASNASKIMHKNSTESQPEKGKTIGRKVKRDTILVVPQKVAPIQVDEPEIVDQLAKTEIVTGEMETNDDSISQAKNVTIKTEESTGGGNDQLDESLNEVAEVKARPGLNAKTQPLGGRELFDTYLEENLQYPQSADQKKREVVRLKFMVSVSGVPNDFSIIKAPENNDFSNEAIRLVKEGPKWSPAIKDGIPVEEEVTLRIIFKPNN